MTFSDLASGLKKTLEEMGITFPITLGGVSMGGYWTMEFLRLFPELVKRVLFIGTRANAETEASRKTRLEMAARMEIMGPDPNAPKPKLLGVTSLAERQNVVQKFNRALRQASPKAVARAHRVIANRRDQSDTLKALKVPAVWMAGTEDLLVKPEEAKQFAALNPKIEWIEFEKSGHLIPWEEPKGFQERLDRFVLIPK
jgi:pimeloyl-ACP methyl ester carboxylesterase